MSRKYLAPGNGKVEMKVSYERIFDLMGRSPDDLLFAHFVRDLDEVPEILGETNHASGYVFPRSGLYLMLVDGHFERAIFELIPHQAGRGKPYTGNLPGGIESSDNRDDVERKLGLKPLHRRADSSEAYDMTPVQVDFFFSGSNETVNLMMIAYTPLGQDMA